MNSFKKSFRGYNKKQVNEFIASKDLKSQSEVDTLKRRINILEEEIRELTVKLKESESKESMISKGLLSIEELKENAVKEIEKRSALEKERLEIFKNKWTDYAVAAARSDYGGVLDALDGYLREYTINVRKTIDKGLNLNEKPIVYQEDEDAKKLAELCKKLGILED